MYKFESQFEGDKIYFRMSLSKSVNQKIRRWAECSITHPYWLERLRIRQMHNVENKKIMEIWECTNAFQDRDQKFILRNHLVERMSYYNHQKAVQLAKSISSTADHEIVKGLSLIAKVCRKQNPDLAQSILSEAIELAKSLKRYKYYAVTKIGESLIDLPLIEIGKILKQIIEPIPPKIWIEVLRYYAYTKRINKKWEEAKNAYEELIGFLTAHHHYHPLRSAKVHEAEMDLNLCPTLEKIKQKSIDLIHFDIALSDALYALVKALSKLNPGNDVQIFNELFQGALKAERVVIGLMERWIS